VETAEARDGKAHERRKQPSRHRAADSHVQRLRSKVRLGGLPSTARGRPQHREALQVQVVQQAIHVSPPHDHAPAEVLQAQERHQEGGTSY